MSYSCWRLEIFFLPSRPGGHYNYQYFISLALRLFAGDCMSMPAAMIGDFHACPMVTGVVPHVGGLVIGPGAPTVFICGLPAIIEGDEMICVGPIDSLILGSATVFACGMPMGRVGDLCEHGGTIVGPGALTVFIGP